MLCVAILQRSIGNISVNAFLHRSSLQSHHIPMKYQFTRSIHKVYAQKGKEDGGRVSTATTDVNLMSKSHGKSVKEQIKLDTNPPKGTRDFYPDQMRMRTWLFDQWRDVARLYGFSEYDAPVLESESLYTRKSGEDVTNQLYNFEDKGERRVALRPEMTPSLARMVMAKKGGLPLPLKWYSIPQCWRYERMTRGRRREHFQWNMDIWGVSGVEAEAELLSAMVTFFQNVGLTSDDVGIKVNSRLVVSEVLGQLGVPDDKFAETCVLIDKLDKVISINGLFSFFIFQFHFICCSYVICFCFCYFCFCFCFYSSFSYHLMPFRTILRS